VWTILLELKGIRSSNLEPVVSMFFLVKKVKFSTWYNPRMVDKDELVPKIAFDYLPRILNSQVYEAAIETPLSYGATLSSTYKNEIYLKREDLQPVFSFKIRGAYNKIAKLPPHLRTNGVVTCSAGNHAQGVALSCSKMNINGTIVMPMMTPSIKVNAVRRLAGPTVTVQLHGNNFDEAAEEAKRLAVEHGYAIIHPFDDPDVIAGQGTIGMEILKVSTYIPIYLHADIPIYLISDER
jgi:threonine dehydratase